MTQAKAQDPLGPGGPHGAIGPIRRHTGLGVGEHIPAPYSPWVRSWQPVVAWEWAARFNEESLPNIVSAPGQTDTEWNRRE